MVQKLMTNSVFLQDILHPDGLISLSYCLQQYGVLCFECIKLQHYPFNHCLDRLIAQLKGALHNSHNSPQANHHHQASSFPLQEPFQNQCSHHHHAIDDITWPAKEHGRAKCHE